MHAHVHGVHEPNSSVNRNGRNAPRYKRVEQQLTQKPHRHPHPHPRTSFSTPAVVDVRASLTRRAETHMGIVMKMVESIRKAIITNSSYTALAYAVTAR